MTTREEETHTLGHNPQSDASRATSVRGVFLRVRVSEDRTPSGYVAAYLADGTQLVVRADDLLRGEQETGIV